MGKSRADERPFWTLEEFQSFIDEVSDKYEAWVAFQILFWTGMRIGELLALKVEDIDLEALTIRIDESYTRLNGKDIISTAFTNKFFCWEGSPSEFVKLLDLDMAPNKLTMHLNVNLGRLAQEYNVEYKSMRTHDGRRIRVIYDPWNT